MLLKFANNIILNQCPTLLLGRLHYFALFWNTLICIQTCVHTSYICTYAYNHTYVHHTYVHTYICVQVSNRLEWLQRTEKMDRKALRRSFFLWRMHLDLLESAYRRRCSGKKQVRRDVHVQCLNAHDLYTRGHELQHALKYFWGEHVGYGKFLSLTQLIQSIM